MNSRGSASCTGSSRATGRVKSWRRSVDAAVDVAADVVRVVGLHLARRSSTRAARIALAEAGGEALDLRLDRVGHVGGRAVRARGSRPSRCACPSGARVGSTERRLRRAARRAARGAARADVALGRRDLLERAAEVDRARAPALRRRPRDRAVERPVELEDAGPVAVALERAAVAVGQPVGRRSRRAGAG